MKGSTTPRRSSCSTTGRSACARADAAREAVAASVAAPRSTARAKVRMPTFIIPLGPRGAELGGQSRGTSERPGPSAGGGRRRSGAFGASVPGAVGIMEQPEFQAPTERGPVYRKEKAGVNVRTDGPLLAREEQQLVEGLLAGNEDAVRALYARFARPIFTLGIRLLGSSEAAEGLTQDGFLTAWRKAPRFDASRGRLSTWLMTIAHNLAVDRLRRETGVTRPTLVLVDEVPEVPAAGDEDPLLERDAAVRALQALSDSERNLLVRTYFGGLTAREIAQADGIPLGTVKTRLRTALIKVRRANQDRDRL